MHFRLFATSAALLVTLSSMIFVVVASPVVDNALVKRDDGGIAITNTAKQVLTYNNQNVPTQLAYAVPWDDLALRYWEKKISKHQEATELVQDFYKTCKMYAPRNYVYAYWCTDPDPTIQANKGVIMFVLACYVTDKGGNIDFTKDLTWQSIMYLNWTKEKSLQPGQDLMDKYDKWLKDHHH